MTPSVYAYVAVHSEKELKAPSVHVAGKASLPAAFESTLGLPGKRMA